MNNKHRMKMEHLEAAKSCLAELLNGTPRARALVEQMRRHLLDARAEFADIGTTKEVVFSTMEHGARLRAEKLLCELREDGADEADYVALIRESVAEAGCTLADIGTCEDELRSFK